MTDERAVIEALSTCRFFPGSFAKRFARDMLARSPDQPLTVRQRQTLRLLVHQFRKQLATYPICAAWLKTATDWGPDRLAFEDMLDTRPDDAATRLVFADWLDEHEEPELAKWYRVMVDKGLFVELRQFPTSAGFICRWVPTRKVMDFTRKFMMPVFRNRHDAEIRLIHEIKTHLSEPEQLSQSLFEEPTGS